MLTVLQIVEGKPERRWFRRRSIPAVTAETVRVPDGLYRLLTAEQVDGVINWYQVWKLAGPEAVRLLLPKGVTPPAGSGITPFAGRELPLAWMRDTLIHRLCERIGYPWSVGIFDPKGTYPLLPLELLPYAADIRVVTDSKAYMETVERAMEQFGAVLRVSADRRMLQDVMWLVAPDGLMGLAFRGVYGTLSGVKQDQSGVVDAYLPKNADKWLNLTPKGIEPERFLAGLYECSHVRRLADPPPAFIRINGRFIPIDREDPPNRLYLERQEISSREAVAARPPVTAAEEDAPVEDTDNLAVRP